MQICLKIGSSSLYDLRRCLQNSLNFLIHMYNSFCNIQFYQNKLMCVDS